MIKFFQLILLRPIERFIAQCIAISTQPTAFVLERIHLRDTTNFMRTAGFFLSAISAAFLAEVATLYLLGIEGLAEPYYWLFILLTSIPFVLICFLLVRFVAPLSLKDVLHLSLYPIGAGVFVGAALALLTSSVVALLVASGYISDIRYDFDQWGGEAQLTAVNTRVLYDCLKGESLVYAILTAGAQAAYNELKDPFDEISDIRPIVTVLYLIIAALFIVTVADRRKPAVFGLVFLAALLATGANYFALKGYFQWHEKNSDCQKMLAERGIDRTAELLLKQMAVELNSGVPTTAGWDLSHRAEGRILFWIFRAKKPIADVDKFHRGVNQTQKDVHQGYCFDDDYQVFRIIKSTQTYIYYNVEGDRLTSFSIGPADCSRW